MTVLITFLEGDHPIARQELALGMVVPQEGQLVVVRGETWQVTRVLIDFSPSIPDVRQVVLCRVRRYDATASRKPR